MGMDAHTRLTTKAARMRINIALSMFERAALQQLLGLGKRASGQKAQKADFQPLQVPKLYKCATSNCTGQTSAQAHEGSKHGT